MAERSKATKAVKRVRLTSKRPARSTSKRAASPRTTRATNKRPASKRPARKQATSGTRHQPTRAEPSRQLAQYLREWEDYPITEIRAARCVCGKAVFALINGGDEAGGAMRVCVACDHHHMIGDSADYWDDDEAAECACPCGNEDFEVAVGFAFYADSKDVRWIYVGLRCTRCRQSGMYVDWKIDYAPSHQLLDQV